MYDYNDVTFKLIKMYAEGKKRLVRMPKEDAARFKDWIERESPDLTLHIERSKSWPSTHSLVRIVDK